jgi:hypothetical protein
LFEIFSDNSSPFVMTIENRQRKRRRDDIPPAESGLNPYSQVSPGSVDSAVEVEGEYACNKCHAVFAGLYYLNAHESLCTAEDYLTNGT